MQNILKGSRALVGLLLLVALFAVGQIAIAHDGGNTHTFSASVSPSSLEFNGTETVTFIIQNTSGESGSNARSAKIILPSNFSVSNPSTSQSGWETSVVGSEIQASDEKDPTPLEPGDSMTITAEITHTGDTGESTNWSVCLYTNSSFSPGAGGQFHPDGNADENGCAANVTIIVGDPEPTTGMLTITKVVTNDNGGSLSYGDFSFQVNGGSAQVFEEDGSNTIELEPETYTITEVPVDGYIASYEGCEDIEITAGGEATCTITNDDQPATLTVVKDLTNDDEGDTPVIGFSFSVNDGEPIFFDEDGTVELTVDAGTYTVVEEDATGYTTTYENCEDIVLTNGGSATCTIFNDDVAPTDGTVTVTKTVTNNHGGDADVLSFTYFVGLTEFLSGITQSLTAGEYYVTEEGPDGYDVTFGGACTEEGLLTVEAGNDYECTITNDDIPATLTVTKVVSNNDETGEASVESFTLFVGDTEVTSGDSNEFAAGTYSITETGPTENYTTSFSGHCDAEGSITMELGGEYECTITNDDIPPTSGTLTVTKEVTNNNGGTAVVEDFTLMVGETEVTSGVSVAFEEGTYSITEEGPDGYAASFGETCAEGEIEIVAGEDHSCTITNDDIAPLLTVIKVVTNDDETATSTVEDFTLFVDEIEVVSGEQNEFDAGTYSITEEGPGLYNVFYSESCAEGEITLVVGGEYTCTITNDDFPAEEPVDVCDNIDGLQTETPDGYTNNDGQCTQNNNGGGGGGNGPIIHGGGGNGPIIPSGGSVLGASTQGEVLGDSCGLYMDKFLRFGSAYNDTDQVEKLQTFLNKWMNSGLDVTGVYGLDSVAAVNAFQSKYSDEILAPWGITAPTGIVYQTTLRQINLLECPALSLGIPSLVAWSDNPNLPKESFGRAIATAAGGNTGTTEATETEEETSEITLDENTDESDQTASVANASDDDGEGFWSRIWNNLFGR